MKKIALLLALSFVLFGYNGEIEPNLDVMPVLEIEVEVEKIEKFEKFEKFEKIEKNETEPTAESDFDFYALLDVDDILHDIDFLVQTLEENFPFMGVVERATGVGEPLDRLRDSLIIHAQHGRLYSFQFENLIRQYFHDIFFSRLAHLDINPAYLPSLEDDFLDFFDFNPEISAQPTIIEEGKIAVIPVNPAFFNGFAAPMREMQELQRFIAQIQGYEHVIIDLTHIGGGWLHTSVETFILPNLHENVYITEFAFITSGTFPQNTHQERLAMSEFFQLMGGSNFFWGRETVGALVPAAEFAEQHNLVNMNTGDLENFAYGFVIETLLRSTTSFSRPSFFSRLPLLADNIWFLISPNNGSAGAIFANMAKEAGFTLVGQQASGRIGRAGRHFFFIT